MNKAEISLNGMKRVLLTEYPIGVQHTLSRTLCGYSAILDQAFGGNGYASGLLRLVQFRIPGTQPMIPPCLCRNLSASEGQAGGRQEGAA